MGVAFLDDHHDLAAQLMVRVLDDPRQCAASKLLALMSCLYARAGSPSS